MDLVLLLIVLLLVFGGLPNWGYHSLGYYPSGVGLILLVVLLVVLLGPRLQR